MLPVSQHPETKKTNQLIAHPQIISIWFFQMTKLLLFELKITA